MLIPDGWQEKWLKHSCHGSIPAINRAIQWFDSRTGANTTFKGFFCHPELVGGSMKAGGYMLF
jgi:hypothetical protein